MHTTRLTQLLLLALSASTAVQAMVVNPEALDGEILDVLAEDGHILPRQATESSTRGPATSPSSSSTDPKPTSSSTSKPPTSAPTSSKPDPTPTSSSTSQPGDKTSETPKPTSESSSSSATTQEPVTSTTVVTTHAPDGRPTTYTSQTVSTPTGSLNTNPSGTTSEMTQDTKNIIIGTVVGIGGAIVLGVAGYLAWRIWGKKKAAEENDGLMSYGGDYPPEAKTEATGPPNARTPFQSTLESYHAPTQVNTASNF